ncbi:Nitrous oxide reductase maturation transmembrane protein NosY [Caenispirillum salinarum AK4]|uniref:Nitrous oxide reductase maturation transmembrane protein NosY n=1 Tax=Caenispirillum salinarum AK4 TaxID=1238182 RepID=K9GMQ1_9PROT|nr:ABC transporter permease subunit [Caenispirillum salinarum]EKV26377.1 Nitrous oxide reductase maturation transmembrane protein NosY [Caenispirillum salinarum AK4]
MNGVLTIAGREIREGLRNRWVAAATLILAALALALALVGSAPFGAVETGRLTVTIVSLSSLSIYLLPLIALLLGFDAIVGERERGTLLLMLAYPVSRWQVVLGKFLGHAAILAFATTIGFGSAAVAIALTADAAPAAAEWWSFGGLVLASIGLGLAFVAVGYVISVAVAERTTAAGVAVVVWLFLVVLYDMGLLGALVATGGQGFLGDTLTVWLLANPADAYRLVTLTGFEGAGTIAGLDAVVADLSVAWPALALAAWIAAPLAVAWTIFSRKEP